jgi:hypothetical protein
MSTLSAAGVSASLDTLSVVLAAIGVVAVFGRLTYKLGRSHGQQQPAPAKTDVPWPAEEGSSRS